MLSSVPPKVAASCLPLWSTISPQAPISSSSLSRRRPPLPLSPPSLLQQAVPLAESSKVAVHLPALVVDPNAEYQPSPFFSKQLTAFEVWLDHGSEHKKPPEQLPIVLQVLLSQSHRFRALVLFGRFLHMGHWAVDLALLVGIFPYVLKLLQTTPTELRQILVLIWNLTEKRCGQCAWR